MKGSQAQRSQRTIKHPLPDCPQRVNSPRHNGLRLNKENERCEEGLHLNRCEDQPEQLHKKVSRGSYMNINSPKANITKPKTVLQQMHTEGDSSSNVHRVVKRKRTDEFAQVHSKIAQLQLRLEGIKNQFKKKPSTGNRKDDKKEKSNEIAKSRSVQKLMPRPPIDLQNLPGLVNLPTSPKTPSGVASISSFVTQVPSPSNALQCSSSTNLSFTSKLKSSTHKYYVSSIVSSFCDKPKTTFTNLCKTHLMNSLQLLSILKNTQKPATLKPLKSLPPTKRRTIVFDLDETLIHCNQSADAPHDQELSINFPNGDLVKVGINVRPWAKECLRELSKWYEIIIFTASHQCYGNVVSDYLDPTNTIIAARYFRDSCHRTADGFYVKDLRIIDRHLQNMLLIDNAAYSYAFQLDNGVPIIPFYDNKNDTELRHLVNFLKGLIGCEDIRKEMCAQLRVNQYPNYTEPIELIKKLYASQIR